MFGNNSDPSRITRPVLSRALLGGAAVALAGGAGLIGAGPASAAPSAQDRAFVTANAQTDLAELTLAGIAQSRAQYPATKELATKTAGDHRAALDKLTAVAKTLGITLPTEPNAAQQADAAKLKSVATSSFDVTYDSVQVTGHQLSISDTQTELSGGTDTSVVTYARGYLPVAQGHLTMATSDLQALGGSVPGSAPAGNGGQRAAADTSGSTRSALELAGGAVLIVGGLAWFRRSRRRPLV